VNTGLGTNEKGGKLRTSEVETTKKREAVEQKELDKNEYS